MRFGFGLTRTMEAAVATPIRRKLRSTALKTWDMCKRKWWLLNVAGLKERDRYHLTLGTVLHSVAERYLSRQARMWEDLFPPGWDKKLRDEDKAWARAMAEEAVAKGLWQAQPNIRVEYPIAYLIGREFRDRRGMPWLAETSACDDGAGERTQTQPTRLLDGRPLPAGWDRLPPYASFIDVIDLDLPRVYDHKTAKSRRYALTSEKLARDLQVNAYAATPLALRPEVSKVALRHNVFLKGEDAEVYAVDAEATVEQVAAMWDGVITAAEEMQLLRECVPAPQAPPERRADNWAKVRGALEEGRKKDACEAYGGCPFKDLCFGRATAQQITNRLDAPDPAKLLEERGMIGAEAERLSRQRATFGLRPSLKAPRTGLITTTTTRTDQERSMPFAKPAAAAPAFPAINQHAYVRDPDNPMIQYRCSIREIAPVGLTLAIWPRSQHEPKLATLPPEYIVQPVPLDAVSQSPFGGVELRDYAAELEKAGMQAPAWEAADPAAMAFGQPSGAAAAPATPVTANAVPPTPGAGTGVSDAQVSSKPPPDGKFGLRKQGAPAAGMAPGAGAALAAQMQRAAEQPAVIPATFTPVVGAAVRVRPTDHSFWSGLVGKQGIIRDVLDTDPQRITVSVEIEGQLYDDVMAGRFEPAGDTPAVPVDIAAIKALKGQLVNVLLSTTPTPFNGPLEDVTNDGIVMMGGAMKASWEQVVSVQPLTHQHIPGAPPPKQPRGSKGKAKGTEGAPASPSTASNPPSPPASAGSTPPSAQPAASTSAPSTAPGATADPSAALDTALQTVNAVLGGEGKVTRKVIEGIQPLLVQAKQYQDALRAVPAASGAQPLFTRQELAQRAKELADAAARLTSMIEKS